MDFIREGYPRIPEEFIDAALDYTDGDAFDTMDVLDAYLRGTSQLNSIPLTVKANANHSIAIHGIYGRPKRRRRRVS